MERHLCINAARKFSFPSPAFRRLSRNHHCFIGLNAIIFEEGLTHFPRFFYLFIFFITEPQTTSSCNRRKKVVLLHTILVVANKIESMY